MRQGEGEGGGELGRGGCWNAGGEGEGSRSVQSRKMGWAKGERSGGV